MIKILEIANRLNKELKLSKNLQIEDYKILIRLNLEIDVYIVCNDDDFFKSKQKQYEGYAVNFRKFSREEIEEYPYLSDSFKEIESIDYGLKYRLNSLLNKGHNSLYKFTKDFPVPIVTFYSYKGGMGRTTTLTSYALDLALNHNKRVCIIDCDFEAPGYLNFFNLANNLILKSGEKNGVVEFLVDYAFKETVDIEDYIISPDIGIKGIENIFLVPAGNLSDTTVNDSDEYVSHRDQYLEGLSRLDLSNEYTLIEGFNNLFKRIHEKIKPDVILIDSRTGFNDIFGTTALMLSNLIVGFFGSSEQTKPGLRFLLDKFYELNSDIENDTELLLINSILPKDLSESESFHNAFISEVGQYVQFIQEKKLKYISSNEDSKIPSFFKLRRNSTLEKLGIKQNDDEQQDFQNHINLIKSKNFSDFNGIFKAINNTKALNKMFPTTVAKPVKGSLALRNLILKNLRSSLRNENGNPILFAEDAEVNPKTFFYREQMSMLFDKNKFLIQGFKGTGKTYLYNALRDPKLIAVKDELLRRASKHDKKDYRFIDIISLKGKGEPKSFDFDQIQLSKIEDKSYYFKNFWLVYTWNSIFLDAKSKLGYLTASKLQEYIKPYATSIETKQRFEDLIYDQNKLAEIEKDLLNLDEHLVKNKIFTFVLYDQLDNLIKPNVWRETVSPLIDYWWDSLNRFKNIAPKIFIRTDLYNRLTGTNTTRLENNIIKIEWSKEEVYSYFFKLILSNPASYDALFTLMERSKRYEDRFFKNTKKYLEKNNFQLKLLLNEIEPFMTSFFGKEVKSTSGGLLGKTFDWLYFNLTNADQQSISLRPFINLIDGSIDDALSNTPQETIPIIHYQYYSSRENRNNAVKQHFDDLIREDFNNDLALIFNYLKEKGDKYKHIFLGKTELYSLLGEVLKYYNTQLESENIDELKEILISNGIIHEIPKPNESIFYFAQLYKYWLGLRSRKYEFKRRR
ncbi:KGGVGR-motif variant AAA ATPase [Pedobacter caeni]|uniref:Cellulose biosynthesis protein BcsQ n=1 Tax=Pedobacter caeni TaxID=288992 RepID=A0A1M5KWR8_9SPHI|nr:AAA family ATPase [Pedobacter caeni]SHG56593.1 Cellulose biosynthesis protein BcsQ [Pedobacter caeni]